MEKKYALDAEREEIERNVEMARDTLTGRPYSLEDPAGLDLDPEKSLHKIDSSGEPVFNFINDRPIVAGLNLAHRPHNARKGHKKGKRHQPTDQAPLDPMTDIKRRERFLQKERFAREQELQREYEQRLQEFELDFQERERELEKEKLYQERRLIAEREHELELERQEARRRHRGAEDDDEDLYGDELDDEDDYGANSEED